jgi:hypothetical protein
MTSHLQSALASMEQVLSKELPVCGEIGAFLLVGHHPGVPQHAHHLIRTLQPTRLVDASPRYFILKRNTPQC